MTESDFSSPESRISDDIAPRIKRARKAKGFTLVQLSERSGVSRAALSKIERGEISPTYATLRKVAIGLDLTIANLLSSSPEKAEGSIEVVRSDEGRVFGEKETAYRLLAGQATNGALRCFISEVHSTSLESAKELHTHDTDDIVFVMDGSVVCHFEGREPIQLNKGDSLSYSGNIPHAFTKALEANSGTDSQGVSPTLLWITVLRDQAI